MNESSQQPFTETSPSEQLPMGSDDIIQAIANIRKNIPDSQKDLNDTLQAFWDPTTGNFKNALLIKTSGRLQEKVKSDYQQVDDLESALKKVQITEKAVTADSLTGLLNKHGFDLALDQTIYACARKGTGFALILTDLDRFKSINDTYGHEIGDEVIKIVGERVSKGIRRTDHIGRLGGDEYGIILPDTDDHHARRISDEIQASFDDKPITIHKGTSDTSKHINIENGMSLGMVYVSVEETRDIATRLDELRKLKTSVESAEDVPHDIVKEVLQGIDRSILEVFSSIKDRADQRMYHDKALRKAMKPVE